MKVSLDSVEWKEFKISGIFEIVNSKPYHKTSLQKGFTPYITRTSFNNGLECCVKSDGLKINPRNTISLGAENADFFYQELEYITGNKMYYLKNKNINRYTGLFLVKMLQSSIKNCGFGYGKGLTGTRLKNRALLLPVDSKGDPHWQFMEDYMKTIEQKYIEDILNYYNKKLLDNLMTGGGDTSCSNLSFRDKSIFIEDGLMKIALENLKLEDVEWREFKISDVFEIYTGALINQNEMQQGKFPRITATDLNNGIAFFTDDLKHKNFRTLENFISISFLGSVFYHKSKVSLDMKIHGIKIKNKELNYNIALF
ncbi:restriction endonuclease subunit S [Campylobacter sp. LH-2024]|uniref:restriction endonuclease subunit S n=1 Tax=Campylobacter sp. LH-2024 TaxID=3239825 RepID=UPI003AA876D8